MAITQNTFTGDGSTTNYSFTFEYIKQADVKASLDGTVTTAFTLANATTLSFNTAPASGVAIRIFRDTAIDNLKATFSPGSAIKAEDLNDNFTQNNFAVQEADFDVATANTTANTAKTTADTAISTANTASTNASNAVTTANTASTNASAAVSTANTASTNASNAVTTANSAATDAATAVTTANSATTTANSAVTTANTATTTANSAVTTANAASTDAATAVSTANTASTNASNAVSTANSANTTAGNAVTTANAASTTANSAATDAATAISTANTASTNASNAVTTANSAASDATSAVSTANTASTNASNAVTTANTASTTATTALNNSRESDGSGGFTSAISKANTAISTANAASSAVSNAVLFDLITNVSSIPGSPSNNDYIEIGNSTGIESFTPLSGLPSGFTGAAGLTVRLRYDSSATSWVFMNYFANDSETRYVAIGNPNPVYYANQAAFPSATTYHGGIAHSHADGAMYYAHGGNWIKMAKADSPTFTGDVTVGPINISSSTGYGAQVDMAANAATLKAQCQQTASQYTLLYEAYQGTNRKFYVDARGASYFAGNVAIGLTNAQTGLHISDGSSLAAPQNTGAGRLTVQNSSSADIQLMSANTGYNHIFFGDQDDANVGVINYVHNSGTNAMTFATNASERLRIDSSGNVLVGKTASSGLTAGCEFRPAGMGLFTRASGNPVQVRRLTNDGDLVEFYQDSSLIGSIGVSGSSLTVGMAGPEKLRIDSSGRVGIGTNSPGRNLVVNGGSSEGVLQITNNTSGTGAANGLEILCFTSGEVQFLNRENADMRFDTNNTERLRIDNSGNVGIGTSSPASILHVNPSADCYVTLQPGSTDGNAGINIRNSAGTQKGYVMYDTDDNYLRFGTNNTERVRINSSGNVGIGTTSPGTKLHVNGTVTTGDISVADNSFIRVRATNDNGSTAIQLGHDGNAKFDGNVGIGGATTGSYDASANNLVVGSASGDEGITIAAGTSSSSGINFADGTSGSAAYMGRILYQHSANALTLHTNGGLERMRIDSSGKVGINISNPGSYNGSGNTLVVGDTTTNAGMTIVSNSANNGHIFFADGTGSDSYRGIIKYEHGNDAMAFNTAETERLRLGSAGQIGLGGANYGTSGQVLTSNGSSSAPTWQDAGGGAWNLIATVTASNSATADVTGTSSTYSKYCIIARGVYNQSSTGYVNARMIDNGTEISSTDYYNAWNVRTHSGTSYGAQSGANENHFKVARCGDISREYSDIYLYFNNPLSSQGSVQMNIVQGHSYSWDGSNAWSIGFNSALYQTNMTSLDGIRFYSASGNLNGTFQLYGIS